MNNEPHQCNLPVHYRYQDGIDEEGVILIEKRFYPIRETEHFYFVLEEWQYSAFKNGCMPSYAKSVKRVSKNGLRRKCYPNKKQAMASYIARKRKQIRYAEDALQRAKYVVGALNESSSFDGLPQMRYGNCAIIGRPDFIDNYVFD